MNKMDDKEFQTHYTALVHKKIHEGPESTARVAGMLVASLEYILNVTSLAETAKSYIRAYLLKVAQGHVDPLIKDHLEKNN